jgi:hypothetical protein
MTDHEVEFVRDMQGFLEFCIQNGLSFALAMGTLSHDVNGLGRYGLFDLQEALDDGFLPKVKSYSMINADSVGEPEESAD